MPTSSLTQEYFKFVNQDLKINWGRNPENQKATHQTISGLSLFLYALSVPFRTALGHAVPLDVVLLILPALDPVLGDGVREDPLPIDPLPLDDDESA